MTKSQLFLWSVSQATRHVTKWMGYTGSVVRAGLAEGGRPQVLRPSSPLRDGGPGKALWRRSLRELSFNEWRVVSLAQRTGKTSQGERAARQRHRGKGGGRSVSNVLRSAEYLAWGVDAWGRDWSSRQALGVSGTLYSVGDGKISEGHTEWNDILDVGDQWIMI